MTIKNNPRYFTQLLVFSNRTMMHRCAKNMAEGSAATSCDKFGYPYRHVSHPFLFHILLKAENLREPCLLLNPISLLKLVIGVALILFILLTKIMT